MVFVSHNPATQKDLATFDELTDEQLEQKLANGQAAFERWRGTSFVERSKHMRSLAKILRDDARTIGSIITLEMGKPISAAIAEVEKCAWVCEYYADHAQEILRAEKVETDASESFVQFEPIGMVLAVMPWNFPFWQVFRFAAPAVMAGNVGLLKHASNVPQSAQKIEALFAQAGFPGGVFQNLLIGSKRVAGVIEDSRVKAATLTGSEPAGRAVAATAARQIKKSVLELGGSDPFIVLADADVEFTCTQGVMARLQNAGQSCIAAKRFIVHADIADEFLSLYKAAYERLLIGDPTDEKTQIGPLATKGIFDGVKRQVDESVAMGAKVLTGGKRVGNDGYFYAPTILTGVAPGMPAYDEEIFGPVASVIMAKDDDEAIAIANDTDFGLGSSLWTKDIKKAKILAGRIEAGSVFINGIVKSDPRLPFGGIKRSGFGRELSHYGMKEFVNVKTVWIK